MQTRERTHVGFRVMGLRLGFRVRVRIIVRFKVRVRVMGLWLWFRVVVWG